MSAVADLSVLSADGPMGGLAGTDVQPDRIIQVKRYGPTERYRIERIKQRLRKIGLAPINWHVGGNIFNPSYTTTCGQQFFSSDKREQDYRLLHADGSELPERIGIQWQ